MSAAKSQAMKQLGKEDDYINLKGFNTERDLANEKHSNTLSSLQSEYNNLLETLANERTSNAKDFSTGRNTVSENSYLSTRNDVSGLSRGLSGGLNQLRGVGNRMEVGRQNSDLANTYYNTLNSINATEKRGTDTYNLNLRDNDLNLKSALADIGAREAAARNNYRQAVANLAEQIQSRWATQAQTAAINKATAQDLQKQLASTYLKSGSKDANDIVKEANDVVAKGLAVLPDGTKVTNTAQALQWLETHGRYRTSSVQDYMKRQTNEALAKAYNKSNNSSMIKWYVDDDGNLAKKPNISIGYVKAALDGLI